MLQAEKEKNFWEFIKLLDKENILKDVVIVGSWAEKVYESVFGYETLLITNDIDIYYKENAVIVKNVKIDINNEMQKLGYAINRDYMTSVTRYNKLDFEIEFLTLLKGDGSKTVRYIEPLGIYSEALRYFDILEEFAITVNMNGYKINIPEPSAYVLHKMIINHNRKPIEKREKDISKVKNLLLYIKKDKKEAKRFVEIYTYINTKYRKTKGYIEDTCKKYDIDISDLINKPIILGATKTKKGIDMLKVMEEQMRKAPKKIMTIYQYHIKTQRIVAIERNSNEKFWDETKKEFKTLISQGKYEIDNEYDPDNSTIYAIVDTKDGKGKYIVSYNIGSIDNAKRLIEKSLKG